MLHNKDATFVSSESIPWGILHGTSFCRMIELAVQKQLSPTRTILLAFRRCPQPHSGQNLVYVGCKKERRPAFVLPCSPTRKRRSRLLYSTKVATNERHNPWFVLAKAVINKHLLVDPMDDAWPPWLPYTSGQ
jgi:hypothetical protein